MKVKLFDLTNSWNILQRLTMVPLYPIAALRLGFILDAAAKPNERYEQERMSLCQQFGILSQDKSHFEFPDPEKAQKFNEEFAKMAAEEIELDCKPIPISELKSISSATPLMFLEPEIRSIRWCLEDK
jgi:hypothetical protein